jgi:hypothetical protein
MGIRLVIEPELLSSFKIAVPTAGVARLADSHEF